MNKEIRTKQLQSDEDDVMHKPRDLFYDDDRSTAYTAIAQTMPQTAPLSFTTTALPIKVSALNIKYSRSTLIIYYSHTYYV